MKRRRAVLIVVAAAAGASVTVAYRHVFARPTDDAFALIPQGARAAIMIDLTPSPSQATQFTQLKGLLDDGEFQKSIQSLALFPLANDEKLVAALKPHVKRGGIAGWMGGQSEDYFLIVPIDDANGVDRELSKVGPVSFLRGAKIVAIKNGGDFASVIGSNLVMAKSKATIAEVEACAEGYKPSLLADPGFANLRNSARDANLAAFYADDGGKAGQGVSWMMASAGVGEGGFSARFQGTVHPARRNDFAAILALKPLPTDLLTRLPDRPMLVGAVAQPGQIVAALSGSEPAGAKRNPNEVENADLKDGMAGDLVVASYEHGDQSFDLVAVADDSYGGHPMAFIDKLTKSIAGDDKKPVFVEADGIFSLTPEREADLRKSMREGAENDANPALVEHVTIAYAKVGGAVVAGSSREIVRRVAERWAHPEPAKSTGMPDLETGLRDGSQVLITASLESIAARLNKNMKGEHKEDFEKVVSMLKNSMRPLSLRLAVKPDGSFVGSAFVPTDFEELAKNLKSKP